MSGSESVNYELVYDGECGFCRYCVAHAARIASRANIRFTPYQSLSAEFRRSNPLDYAKSIQLFRSGQWMAGGAGAALKLRALGGKPAFWRLYQQRRYFRRLSEWAYLWVSRHRGFCYRVARRIWPAP